MVHCTACISAARSTPISGIAGKYMSMANGPTAATMPRMTDVVVSESFCAMRLVPGLSVRKAALLCRFPANGKGRPAYPRPTSTSRTRSTGRFSTKASIAKMPVTVSKSNPVISR